MDGLLLVLVLLLNIGISLLNCYFAGVTWKDTMTIGGRFDKLVLWSAVIQSGVGFSMPIILALAWGSVAFLTSGVDPTITPAEGKEVLQAIFNLWYVAVILPILGSGLAIWAHSLRTAYQQRDFASIAVAGWNTFAQIHNTVSAVENIGGALGNLGKFFSSAVGGGGDAKEKIFIIVILILVISLVAGFMITFALVRHFARTSTSRIEEYAATLPKGRARS